MGRACLLVALVLSTSCASNSPDAASCATAVLDARGGALVAPEGATLVVPPGALDASTEVSVCTLNGFPMVRDQQSALVVVRPPGLTLREPASFTLPIGAQSISEGRVQVGQSVDDAAPVTLTELRSGPASVAFDHDRFGYFRVLGMAEGSLDGGTRDSPFVRIDAGPMPLAPVVVGLDLEPADYTCLGTRVLPPRGEPVETTLHVRDWHDDGFRAGYQFRVLALPPNPDVEFDCSTRTDCTFGQSDATGSVTLTIPSGPVWIDVLQFDPAMPFPEDRRVPIRHVHLPIEIPATGGDVVVPAVSQNTANAAGVFTAHFGQLTMGVVRDCDGRPVQRARIRAFDQVGDIELDRFVPNTYSYGTTSGIPAGGRTRTGADGTFLVDNQVGAQELRVEAWGQLVADGPEIMLSCELRTISTSMLVVADMLPAASDRSSTCSE